MCKNNCENPNCNCSGSTTPELCPPPIKPPMCPYPTIPAVAQGESLLETVNKLVQKVNQQGCVYNEVIAQCYAALNNMIMAAEANGAYYGKDEVWTEEGYLPDTKTNYTVIHKAATDKKGQPITMNLHLAYDNGGNLQAKEPIFDASLSTLANVIVSAIPVTGNGWFGNVFKNGTPLDTSASKEYFTVGFDKSGLMKTYANSISKEQLMKDNIQNAMGVYGVTVMDGKLTDGTYIESIPNKTDVTARVVMGQNEDTKEVIFVMCTGVTSTDSTSEVTTKYGMTTAQAAQLLLDKGCTIGVELASAANAGGLDTAINYIQQDEDATPALYAYWYITKRCYYKNQLDKDMATTLQMAGKAISSYNYFAESIKDTQTELKKRVRLAGDTMNAGAALIFHNENDTEQIVIGEQGTDNQGIFMKDKANNFANLDPDMVQMGKTGYTADIQSDSITLNNTVDAGRKQVVAKAENIEIDAGGDTTIIRAGEITSKDRYTDTMHPQYIVASEVKLTDKATYEDSPVKLHGISDGLNDNDAVNKKQLDTLSLNTQSALENCVQKSGDQMNANAQLGFKTTDGDTTVLIGAQVNSLGSTQTGLRAANKNASQVTTVFPNEIITKQGTSYSKLIPGIISETDGNQIITLNGRNIRCGNMSGGLHTLRVITTQLNLTSNDQSQANVYVRGVGTPVNNNDAANKEYVDNTKAALTQSINEKTSALNMKYKAAFSDEISVNENAGGGVFHKSKVQFEVQTFPNGAMVLYYDIEGQLELGTGVPALRAFTMTFSGESITNICDILKTMDVTPYFRNVATDRITAVVTGNVRLRKFYTDGNNLKLEYSQTEEFAADSVNTISMTGTVPVFSECVHPASK